MCTIWCALCPFLYYLVSVQELQVFIHLQEDEPEGYDPEAFNGVWPEGGVWVIKLCVPPNMKTWRTESNWHNIVILLAYGENPNNHLHLGPLLQRIVSTNCDCPSGDRTNSWCSHVMSGIIALFSPTTFNSTKILEVRMKDYMR